MGFLDVTNPTAFGIFDSDTTFQADADSIINYVKRALGDDVLSVELTSKTIWDAFEEATLVWGAIINEFQARSNMATLLGQSTGSNVQNLYPRETLEFLIRQAEPYSQEASYSGYQNQLSGSITLEKGRQDYDLVTELVDGNGTPLFDLQPTGSQGRMRITEVFHFSPAVAFRFFDSTSAINFLNNEFNFESFTPETIFYVLPVFEDLLRQGQLQLSQRVRRSNYSYRVIGQQLRIMPVPIRDSGNPRKLFVRVSFPGDPFNNKAFLSGSADDSIFGISNLSNIPYDNLSYNTINSVGKQWIREYTLALCMIRLGYIRGKVRNIPVPNTDVQLNYDDLLTRGYEEKERLRTQLRDQLENLTYDSLVEQQATKSENLMRQLRGVPMPNGFMIVAG
jgi:hypothetical protein